MKNQKSFLSLLLDIVNRKSTLRKTQTRTHKIKINTLGLKAVWKKSPNIVTKCTVCNDSGRMFHQSLHPLDYELREVCCTKCKVRFQRTSQ